MKCIPPWGLFLLLGLLCAQPAGAYFHDYGQTGLVPGNGVASKVVQVTDPASPDEASAGADPDYFVNPWSPDSKWLIYTEDVDGSRDIQRIRETGDALLALTYAGSADTNAQFSPDGTEVLYQWWNTDRWEICTMDNFGNDKDCGFEGKFPLVSPDGTNFVFVDNSAAGIRMHAYPPDDNPFSVFFIIDADGDDNNPQYAWSPDSTAVAYHTTDEEIKKYVLDPEETVTLAESSLADMYCEWPCFSADGSRLAYVLRYLDTSGAVNQMIYRLMEIDASDGGNVKQLVTTFDDRSDGNEAAFTRIGDGSGNSRLSYSPDGRYIFYTKYYEVGSLCSIFAWDRYAERDIQLTQGHRDYYPVVSPDGKWLLFEDGVGGSRDASSNRNLLLLKLIPRSLSGVMNILLEE